VGLTRLQPGSCCGCVTGFTCGGCAGIPDTLHLTCTFVGVAPHSCSATLSCTLTRSGSIWSGTLVESCGNCTGCIGGALERVSLSCAITQGRLTFGFDDYGDPGSCAYNLTGLSPSGTFRCSPFLWTLAETDSVVCRPRFCQDAAQGACMRLSTITLSA
jgi:hypothetical protein